MHTETSRSILEAFYYGRAFAETLNAKVGAALEDVLSDISKQSAESSQAVRCVCQPLFRLQRACMQSTSVNVSAAGPCRLLSAYVISSIIWLAQTYSLVVDNTEKYYFSLSTEISRRR